MSRFGKVGREMAENKKNEEPQLVAPSLIGSSRLAITLMCGVASFNALLMTINLGMVIVCMNKHNSNSTIDIETNCTTDPKFQTESTCVISKENDVSWDKSSQGLLLSATYYGVVFVQIPVGLLSDKFGRTKLMMIFGSTLLGLASVFSPLIIQYAGVPFFFAVRVIKGAAMATILSPILPLLSRWTTAKEQGLLVGLAFAGVGLANAATYPIAGLLCTYSGWKSIFYFSGGCGLLWSIAALFLMYDSPETHPRVSVEEKQYILTVREKSSVKKKKVAIPWAKIFTSIPVWSVIVTNFFFFAATKGTVINLPLYIRDVLDFTVTENGILSAIPSVLSLIVHLITGPVFDFVRAKQYFSITVVRKIFTAIGTLIPSIMMFTVSQLPPEQKYVIIGLISIGYALYEVAWMGGFSFCMLDMAPDYVGILQGINNTIGLMPGFIMPVVISTLTPEGTAQEWSYVFMMFGGLFCLSGLTYLLTGSSELQSWGKIADSTKEDQVGKSLEKIVV